MLQTELPHPVDREGFKAIDCPFYGECLMHAAKCHWNAWTCEECSNLGLDAVCQKLRFIAPYYQLLAEIYPEFREKYEPVMNSLYQEG